MNKILRYVFVALLAVASNASFAADAEPEVTLDFTSNDAWKLPTKYAKDKATFSNGTYSITLEAASSGYKFNSYKDSGCLIFGKKDEPTLKSKIIDFSDCTTTDFRAAMAMEFYSIKCQFLIRT